MYLKAESRLDGLNEKQHSAHLWKGIFSGRMKNMRLIIIAIIPLIAIMDSIHQNLIESIV